MELGLGKEAYAAVFMDRAEYYLLFTILKGGR